MEGRYSSDGKTSAHLKTHVKRAFPRKDAPSPAVRPTWCDGGTAVRPSPDRSATDSACFRSASGERQSCQRAQRCKHLRVPACSDVSRAARRMRCRARRSAGARRGEGLTQVPPYRHRPDKPRNHSGCSHPAPRVKWCFTTSTEDGFRPGSWPMCCLGGSAGIPSQYGIGHFAPELEFELAHRSQMVSNFRHCTN